MCPRGLQHDLRVVLRGQEFVSSVGGVRLLNGIAQSCRKEIMHYWGEPERAPQLLVSIAPVCVHACVRVYVRTWRRQMSGSECGVRCMRTSTVSSENDRTSVWIT